MLSVRAVHVQSRVLDVSYSRVVHALNTATLSRQVSVGPVKKDGSAILVVSQVGRLSHRDRPASRLVGQSFLAYRYLQGLCLCMTL